MMKNATLILAALFLCLPLGLISSSYGADINDINALKKLYTRDKNIPFPADNPHTIEKENLGKMLFFDPRLSKSGLISCATCHNPALSWEDGMALGVGHEHKKLERATPSIINLAWDTFFFWDGRAQSLEEQALIPITSDREMATNLESMLNDLSMIAGYKKLFQAAFPEEENPITKKENMAKALATYERTLISNDAPFDKWIEGDETAISEKAKNGFILFNTKANCAACHSGWRFSDGSFHDIGINDEDIGRGKTLPDLVTMQHAFKTVGLRNITMRAPYMHNGSLATLEDVINHYDKGFVIRKSLSDEIKPLHLTPQEKSDLLLFLQTLTSNDDPITLPQLPR